MKEDGGLRRRARSLMLKDLRGNGQGVWFIHQFIASQSSPPYPHPSEKIGISVYSFVSKNIIETFVISELTEVQRYWGKKELQVLQITIL